MALSWIKLLLSLLIVCFSTALGYFAGNDCRARKKYFTEFARMNEHFLNELQYMRKPVGAFLRDFSAQNDFNETIRGYLTEHKAKVAFSYLKAEERSYITEYFDMMGRGDSPSQKRFFESRRSELARKKEESEQIAHTRAELYLKLGLLAGLAIVILII